MTNDTIINKTDDQNYVIVWEAPARAEPVEFRLYYDESGDVRFYTCEKLEGNYIVIDRHIYAEARPYVKVVNGEIIRDIHSTRSVVSKLMPANEGVCCVAEDLSIVADPEYKGNTTKWKLAVYEL